MPFPRSATRLFFSRLLRMHPAERGRDVWFQEEARAERLSNFIRLVYILAWLISTTLHAPGNNFWSNFTNLGLGGVWFVWSLVVLAWLWNRPYRLHYKFITTAADMVIITSMIWFYQYSAGPAYALKVPTFFNYFCCLGLAALRFKRSLAVFGGVLAVVLHLLVFLIFNLRYDIAYGTGIEHTLTSKINWHYIAYQEVYLVIFSFLTYVIAVNVKRLVELRARETEAAHRAQERAVVAAGVAHEIKNPLEGIYGAAQLLQEEGKGNPRFIEMILKDSVRLNEVVQNFLRFSRPFTAKSETFDLAAVVRDLCRAQSDLTPEAPVEFDGGPEAYTLVSDSEGIRQILRNLIQNARRFQPASAGPVRVGLESGGEVAEVWVEDDGEGVSEENRGKLFEPFFTTSSKGTGLGLAISRKIARELGGELYYEALEPGSRFTLVVKARKEGGVMSAQGCVLVVDDEENIRTIVSAALASVAGKILTAESAEQALELLREENVDTVVSDIRMPGMDGLEFLQQVKQEQPGIRFLMITAHGTLDTAVRALRYGASDFLTKPFENAELRQIVARLLSQPPVAEAVREASNPGGEPLSGVIGQSPAFIAALEKVRKAAQSDSTVLLLGESGTGKEVMARALHDLSARKDKPFIPVNCGAIPENLIESELFGHEKGAFTGAMSQKPGKFVLAEGGTVLLDEMGELPLAVQVKLLRVLQERKVDPVGGRNPVRVDFRLVAATNRNLREEVRQGRFREDLYFRLNVIPVELPPLRERGADVLLLARHYLGHFNKRYGASHRLSTAQEKILLDHTWPGNVRELANVMERAVVLASGPGLALELEGNADKGASTSFRERKQNVERDEILKALELCRWNKTQTAQHLGVSRRGLLYKIKEYGIR